MTREEVRVLTLAKLRLRAGQTVYDIGAGTGSLTVEAGLLVQPGTVYAIEEDSRAVALIEANTRRLGVDNVRVVAGPAPEVLIGLPEADRIIVGGSRGKLIPLLERSWDKLRPGGRMVINAVTLETLQGALATLHGLGGGVEACCVQVARLHPLGPHHHTFRNLHQVYLIGGEKAYAG